MCFDKSSVSQFIETMSWAAPLTERGKGRAKVLPSLLSLTLALVGVGAGRVLPCLRVFALPVAWLGWLVVLPWLASAGCLWVSVVPWLAAKA